MFDGHPSPEPSSAQGSCGTKMATAESWPFQVTAGDLLGGWGSAFSFPPRRPQLVAMVFLYPVPIFERAQSQGDLCWLQRGGGWDMAAEAATIPTPSHAHSAFFPSHRTWLCCCVA